VKESQRSEFLRRVEESGRLLQKSLRIIEEELIAPLKTKDWLIGRLWFSFAILFYKLLQILVSSADSIENLRRLFYI